MAESPTMQPSEGDVEAFLEALPNPQRRDDASILVALLRELTQEPPVLWAVGIVGFGRYHYRYPSGREGDAPAAGFAPRKQALVVYVLDGVSAHQDLLRRLGPHSATVGCIYVKDLELVDLDVLEQIVARSYATLSAGTYMLRARDGGRA